MFLVFMYLVFYKLSKLFPIKRLLVLHFYGIFSHYFPVVSGGKMNQQKTFFLERTDYLKFGNYK